jgi:hypothetical protein
MRSARSFAFGSLLLVLLFLPAGCDTIGGPDEANAPPETEIVEPTEPSGTLTVPDGTPIVFRWHSVDPEEQAGGAGGLAAFQIGLDGDDSVIIDCPPDSGEWWFSSSEEPDSPHFISSANSPQGGNASHVFRVRAQDVEGCWEAWDEAPRYVFWYNYPPSSEILSPQPSQVVAATFTVTWHGEDPDGEIAEYQYVLDPSVNQYSVTSDTSVSYTDVASGEHQFRLRARDGSECWELEYSVVTFQVE